MMSIPRSEQSSRVLVMNMLSPCLHVCNVASCKQALSHHVASLPRCRLVRVRPAIRPARGLSEGLSRHFRHVTASSPPRASSATAQPPCCMFPGFPNPHAVGLSVQVPAPSMLIALYHMPSILFSLRLIPDLRQFPRQAMANAPVNVGQFPFSAHVIHMRCIYSFHSSQNHRNFCSPV